MLRIAFAIVLSAAMAAGCRPRGEATTQPAPRGREAEAAAAYLAYADAAAAQDREAIERVVLLPTDAKRRAWAQAVIRSAELRPTGDAEKRELVRSSVR